MVVLEAIILSGSKSVIGDEVVEELNGKLRGQMVLAGDDTYDEVRTVWNAMIDRKPAIIVRCTGPSDVINLVNFARDNDLLLAVRGGGHSFAGNAVCDGGFVIDLSPMQGVRVDPVKQTARAEPGVIWINFDIETQAFGLATTGGTNSDIGIAGLTLGGGIGWLCRKHGLALDNLLSVDIVTADGRFLTASLPEVDAYFHYRSIDVSTIKELARRWHPEVASSAPEKTGGHRALDDIRESIAELRHYREHLFTRP